MAYTLTVGVAKGDAIKEVGKTCSYMGVRTVANDGGNLYNNISTSKEDSEMMERFWNEACHTLTSVGKEFVASSGESSGTFAVEYELPDRYNKSMDGSVRQMAFSCVVYYILSKWLAVCGMGEIAQGHGQMAALLLKRLESFLYSRVSTRAQEGGVGGNTLGDVVDSFSGSGDGGDGGLEGGNVIGGIFPQGFGPTKVQRYTWR